MAGERRSTRTRKTVERFGSFVADSDTSSPPKKSKALKVKTPIKKKETPKKMEVKAKKQGTKTDDSPAKAATPKAAKPKKAAALKAAPAKASPKTKAPAKPKVSKPKLSADEMDAINSLSIAELKEKLGSNDQLKGGSKPELVARVVDCKLNGCLPRCPQCGGGRLKASGSGYKCPGFHDDDHYRPCSYKTKTVDRPKWVD
eukprot:TRINITY_DN551_c0_g1_i1.p1 TRINITY_DN551_c0_g1~~TRINITY_DN551_c0_g1_i1.p1  ORF type:complete len:201 (+),score=39.90 TRINITY_DN551_c0_g1_i1:296-898(+)